jgi:hypothetical protein
MDTVTSKRSVINPFRLVKLFGIVVGSIILIAVIAAVSFAEWPLVTATLWHVRNGNTVQLEGHSFRFPLSYEPEVSKGGKEIDLIQYPRLFSGGSSVTVESTPNALDIEAISRWQAAVIAAGNHHRYETVQSVPLTLHGRKLTFVCVDLVVGGGESLICRAVGTDLAVSTWASPTHVKETRTVLETSE